MLSLGFSLRKMEFYVTSSYVNGRLIFNCNVLLANHFQQILPQLRGLRKSELRKSEVPLYNHFSSNSFPLLGLFATCTVSEELFSL